MKSASRNLILIAGSLIIATIMAVLFALQKALPGYIGENAAANVVRSNEAENASEDIWTKVADLKDSSKSRQERMLSFDKAIMANEASITALNSELARAQLSPQKHAKLILTICTEIERLKTENAKLKGEVAILKQQTESEADSYQREIDTLTNANELISDEIDALKDKSASENSTE